MDGKGENVGIFDLQKALDLAKEKNTDLLEVSPAASPPVCRLMDYGKYLYVEKRKSKLKIKSSGPELREVRASLRISEHDIEVKTKKIAEFLEQKDKVKIEMFLKGREKYLDKKFIEERFARILQAIEFDYKIIDGPKRTPRGMSVLIEKS